MGPNYGLDKGFVATTVIREFRAVMLTSNTQVKEADTAAVFAIGVAQWTVDDTTKIAYGKVTVDVRVNGISRVVAGVNNITRGSKVGIDNQGRATNAGAGGTAALGIALSPSAAVGDWIDVLLTPGAVV
jgi:hypothetical protein